MTAHCRLRQLHHVAELGDRQLASFQDREHAHTNRIGEDCKLIDNWRRTIHPYSRMKGYIMRQAYVKRAFRARFSDPRSPASRAKQLGWQPRSTAMREMTFVSCSGLCARSLPSIDPLQ